MKKVEKLAEEFSEQCFKDGERYSDDYSFIAGFEAAKKEIIQKLINQCGNHYDGFLDFMDHHLSIDELLNVGNEEVE